MLKGIDVTLYEKREIGKDSFNKPIYEETPVIISNVLVSPAASSDVTDTLNLTGKRAEYTLCIPKGNASDWTDATVGFFGKKWHTIGIPKEYIEEMVPLAWNKQVNVERYE